MLHIQCPSCLTSAYTEDGANPDAAVRCTSPAGEPEGSADGCCSTLGHSHDEHAEHVARTGDASSRPLVITVMPGSVTVQPASN